MERKKGVQDSYDSLELYQEAIRLLSPLLQMRDPKVVGAYVLLCYLEDNVCLRAGLAPSFGGMCGIFLRLRNEWVQQRSSRAVFWCYARIGIGENPCCYIFATRQRMHPVRHRVSRVVFDASWQHIGGSRARGELQSRRCQASRLGRCKHYP